ncbi:urea ABC transporter permease subunit UrtC [filamentous cyanobacterium CCT1]|nr:urea ABC transporter permease subunit UrtC [filamentous cyanobacterium CCT1]PSN78696.1 urea ABC transporter permease subunit UrtC [filamentous cyanobacterium CCP4]
MTTVTTQPRRAAQASQKRKFMIEAIAVIAIALILILVMPMLLTGFRLNLLGRFLALAIVALGIDLIWGFTGLLSLGHGIFFALGGYAFAMYLELNTLGEGQLPEFFGLYGVTELPWFWQPFNSFPFTLLAIFTIPAIVAGLLGYLVFRNRIRGVYFSILTQAALVVFFNLFNGQQKLINGTNGLKTSTSVFMGQAVGSDGMRMFFYISTVIALIAMYALCRWLTSGRFGRMLVAIRDDENRVRFSGYDPTAFKVLVFAVSGAIAGIAGALYTVQSGIISPQFMDIAFSIEMVIWVAVGGRATLVGAILGAVLVNMARSLLSERFPDVWLFFQGALFLIVVTALPDGIIGWGRRQFGAAVSSALGLAPTDLPYLEDTDTPVVETVAETPEFAEK